MFGLIAPPRGGSAKYTLSSRSISLGLLLIVLAGSIHSVLLLLDNFKVMESGILPLGLGK